MSITLTTVAGGAAAAAARRRAEEEEEMQMTGYTTDDLSGWEFKIMRSTFGAFRNPTKVRQLLDLESRAGWELVEKFDDSRIRLKRRVEKRRDDAALGFDPYRTTYGAPEYTIAFIVLGVIVAIVLIALLFAKH